MIFTNVFVYDCRLFERQIQTFDDWYNMVHSLLQKENIKTSLVGIIDLDNVCEKAIELWEELEKRFDNIATKLTPSQLKEQTDEWKDANK